MATRVGTLLVVLGCGGILVCAYLLCSGSARPAWDEALDGTLNPFAIAASLALLLDILGAVLLQSVPPTERPGWVVPLLVAAVLVPASVALWFGVLCHLLGAGPSASVVSLR